jgi:4-aminobutyrate aminotransferase
MIGVELVRDGDPAPDIANTVLEGTKRRGVLIGKGGLHGNVLRIAPPLSLTRAEAEEGLAALVAAIEEVP